MEQERERKSGGGRVEMKHGEGNEPKECREKEKLWLMGGLGAECSGGKIRKTHLQEPVRGIFKVGESITEFQAGQPDSSKLWMLVYWEQDNSFHLGKSDNGGALWYLQKLYVQVQFTPIDPDQIITLNSATLLWHVFKYERQGGFFFFGLFFLRDF